MKIIKKILLASSLLLVIAIVFMWYMDFFATIKSEERVEGGFMVAGIEITGPYSKAGKHIGEVDGQLKELGVICTKGFGIYYDDPKITPQEKCRSLVGNILEEKDFNRIEDIQLKGLKIDSIPKAEAIVIEFPLKNRMSYMIGPMKVYPEFSKYMKEKKYKPILSFEIYDGGEKKIIYAMQYIK